MTIVWWLKSEVGDKQNMNARVRPCTRVSVIHKVRITSDNRFGFPSP